jgi:transposase
LLKEVAELRAQVAELIRERDEARRAGKRQAAPFRKGPPKPDPQTPGRKAGAAHGAHGHRPTPPPDEISECHEAQLPDACPACCGRLVETAVAQQYQTEIPRRPLVRQFNVHIGHCQGCGKRVQGRHPLQTSDALGAAASQIGPDAQAAATTLHTQMGLAHGKVAAVFATLFGIDLTRGASAQINLRAATRLAPDYQRILADVRTSAQIAADETGWREGGQPAWLHVWVSDRATAYAVDAQRSAAALERVIGLDWDGILSHDGYATYERFTEAIHQQCVAHVLRRAQELLDRSTRGAVHFPRRVITLFQEAIHWRNRYLEGEVPLQVLESQREAYVPDGPEHRADQLAGGASDSPGGRESQSLGRQPHPGGLGGARRADVGAGDLPPPGTLRDRLHQPNATLRRQSPPAPTHPAPNPLNKYP